MYPDSTRDGPAACRRRKHEPCSCRSLSARAWAALGWPVGCHGNASFRLGHLDEDVKLVREHAAAFVVEALEQARSVYRLSHERVAEQLRGSVPDATKSQQRMVRALRLPLASLDGAMSPMCWDKVSGMPCECAECANVR